MVRRRPLLVVLVLVMIALSAASCIHVFHGTDPPIESPSDTGSVDVMVPMRAHLADGGVVVFRGGAAMTPDTDAARGLSLHTAGADYYEQFVVAADPQAPDRKALRAALIEHERRAAAWAHRARGKGRIDADDLPAIADVWSSLWSRLRTRVDPRAWERLAPLRQ